MKFKPTLTPRLRVREFEAADRDFLLRFPAKPGQLKYMLFSLATEAEVDEFLDIVLKSRADENRSEWHLLVELLSEGSEPLPIGSVDLMSGDPDAPDAELGYFFLSEHWGRGYAVEASRVLLDFAFNTLGLHRVWGKCHSANGASARVMEKLGMTREGTIREHVWMRDHWRTSYLYGILDREWPTPGA